MTTATAAGASLRPLGKTFFDQARGTLFGGMLTAAQVAAILAIHSSWQKYGQGGVDAEAYVFATIYNEVGPELQPKPENLNYQAARIRQVWPGKFKTVSAAVPYAHNPIKLANRVYANILDNGNEASGDGFKYRGHGYQTTGRKHFTNYAHILGVDLVNYPELLDTSVANAAAALIIGMVDGSYTGRSLKDYLDGVDEPDAEDLREFTNARRTVNGTFNAEAIAHYALNFEHALRA